MGKYKILVDYEWHEKGYIVEGDHVSYEIEKHLNDDGDLDIVLHINLYNLIKDGNGNITGYNNIHSTKIGCRIYKELIGKKENEIITIMLKHLEKLTTAGGMSIPLLRHEIYMKQIEYNREVWKLREENKKEKEKEENYSWF